jgi:hypothetical protein
LNKKRGISTRSANPLQITKEAKTRKRELPCTNKVAERKLNQIQSTPQKKTKKLEKTPSQQA